MRSRLTFPLVGAILTLALTALLLAWPTPLATPGWAAGLAWTDLQGPTGGPAQALALNPAYPLDPTVMAGGGRDFGRAAWAGQGIFTSLDGGITWAIQGGPPQGALFDVAFSPEWVADGYALAGLWQGIWATPDRGATWQELSSLASGGPAFISAVAVGATLEGDHILLAGSAYGGIRRSADDGATWGYAGDPGSVRRLRFHPVVLGLALAATANGLWRSVDAGLQWTRVTSATQIFDVAFDADGSNSYATFDRQLWHSGDAGLTWEAVAGPTADLLDPIGLSSDGAALFTAARSTLYRFDLAAQQLVTVTTDLPTQSFLRLAPSPDFSHDETLLASTYDGVWISRDGGATFARSAGFAPFALTHLEAAAGDPDGDLFAAGDYGVWRRTDGAWQPANAGILGTQASSITDLAVSPTYASDQTLFAARVNSSSIGAALYKSTDRGAAWRQVASAAYIGEIDLSPAFATDRRAFMVADQRLLTSVDGGENWAAQPFWADGRFVRRLVISPDFAANQRLYAVGDQVYHTADGGTTWQLATTPPPIDAAGPEVWQPGKLAIGAGDRLYLTIYRYATIAPYTRQDQLWTSTDHGDTWARLAAAPDLPMAALAIGPTAGGEMLFLSIFDDSTSDDRAIAPDLYASRDHGATWQNLGAVPGGAPAMTLDAPEGAADTLLAGGLGAWQLAATLAPTATPDPCQDLLLNRSFEYAGEWRIPVTAYSASLSLARHSHGWWSMRTGIVEAADNVRSYSDFSQDVTLPELPSITLHFQRWPQGTQPATTAAAALTSLAATTSVDAFYANLAAVDGDLQYGMVIEPPDGALHLLYLRLDDDQVWVDEHFDLTAYAGKTVRLQFGTYNDGTGPLAAQYFDAFSLAACSGAAPTPSPWPTFPSYEWLPYISQPSGGTIPPLPAAAGEQP